MFSVKVQIPTKCSQIHRGKGNGHFYALNLSDTFPADVVGPQESKKQFRRFRSEFVAQSQSPLASECHGRESSSMNCDSNSLYGHIDAKSMDASQVKDASIHLRTVLLPKFVKKLDNLEVLPIDSRGITMELHKHGINARYLGLIFKLTRLPYIRNLCAMEMIARAGKQLFRETIRNAILQFRSVEAAYIDDELNFTAVKFFQQLLGSLETQRRVWEEQLSKIVSDKFDVQLTLDDFTALHKPALFISLQYHVSCD